eukprot:TRINITY_DN30204_c0_g1_i1.p1 TRINITY_DN30204_c0_g1~~TRINITY_DN30204_c0_g1_i1.p1  ORF type:complete len:136 (+),score=17.00 TRINITY_DN30204_c0_g1_i1:22-429(+)
MQLPVTVLCANFWVALACDGCSGLPKWTADINADGVVDEDDDPCCYPHTWSLRVCLCDDEYERLHGKPKPEADLDKPLYSPRDDIPGYVITDGDFGEDTLKRFKSYYRVIGGSVLCAATRLSRQILWLVSGYRTA